MMGGGWKEAVLLRCPWRFVFPGVRVRCTAVYHGIRDDVGALCLAATPVAMPQLKAHGWMDLPIPLFGNG